MYLNINLFQSIWFHNRSTKQSALLVLRLNSTFNNEQGTVLYCLKISRSTASVASCVRCSCRTYCQRPIITGVTQSHARRVDGQLSSIFVPRDIDNRQVSLINLNDALHADISWSNNCLRLRNCDEHHVIYNNYSNTNQLARNTKYDGNTKLKSSQKWKVLIQSFI